MKEKVYIRIYTAGGDYITDQDVSGFTAAQVDEMIRIKEEHGLECRIKRVFINGEV